MDAAALAPPQARSPAFARLTSRPLLSFGLFLALLVLAAALLAPLLAPHDPLLISRSGLTRYGSPAPPGGDFPLGADSRGRDLLSRLLFGARLSLTVSVGAVFIATLFGLAVGVTAGYFGGWADGLLMRLTDAVMAFPAILLALALAAVLPGRSVVTLVLVIGFVNWAAMARVYRSETLSLREAGYVDAARALGASRARILFRHILPHLAPTVLVLASLGTAATILLDAGLSFLGVGVPPPAPSWGSMLQEARTWYPVAPWLAFWPGLAVVITVAAFNLIAFDLRRTLGRGAG